MLENVLHKTKVAQESCEAIIRGGQLQCFYKKVPGSKFCIMHGGKNTIEADKARNYQLFKYRQRINELADNDQVKSLREEIGIIRLLLEKTINKCEDDDELIMFAPRISDLAMKIEKLVSTCHKLESSLGFLMDKTSVLKFSTQIVNIVSNHVQDNEVLDNISEEVIATLKALENSVPQE